MKSMTHPWWLLAGLAVFPAAQAGSQSTDSSTEAAVPATADSKIAIDPATGKPRPLTAEERQQLAAQRPAAAAKSRRSEPLGAGKRGFVAPATEAEAQASLRTLPGGAVMQQVPESMMSELTVYRDAEGRLHLRHGDSSAAPQSTEEPPHE
ncbi:post-PEP-CTERM-1 domain-containing protein [Pseudoxanthomonas wuyuanensis]|uniref:Uncharacterized protein n=1 Tax=Pseudoxanthomonas wuyuanensis TaxID=1073196 RepID=A0A286D8A7_9GAMM|nr:hypothetical protein [Pseudoxanthomonas wuyuanensis]KAF1717305.1 hypothetical protein CSC75_18610 [Pseudoxanthomonas wuyuanensis]SOD54901.1 hypothetical protein SAMN06296416_105174 [Pseudoxanthomonas wuyuanensis]